MVKHMKHLLFCTAFIFISFPVVRKAKKNCLMYLKHFVITLCQHILESTLKDLKTQKSKFVKLTILNVSIVFRFGKNKHQHVSKIQFEFHIKMINNFRVTVYQKTIPLDSKAAV